MALGDTDINTTNVGSEIGSSSDLVSVLVGASGLNKYSRYAPGQLDVDANYDVTLTPPVSNYKLADYRRYDNSATTPSVNNPVSGSWGPTGTYCNVTFAYAPQEMNIKAFTNPGDYVTVKVYSNTTDRTNQANAVTGATAAISWNAHTPLVEHSRQVTQVANTGYVGNTIVVSIPVTGGDETKYAELFISDISANRKINFGVRANNYCTVTTHQYVNPYLYAIGLISGPPAGYTAAFIRISTTTGICDNSGNISQTVGTNTFAFYARIMGVISANVRAIEQSTCTVTLTLRGEAQTIYSSPLSYSSPTYISGTLSNSKYWAYDDAATITATATFPATPGYTAC